jgi:hypothetical protein
MATVRLMAPANGIGAITIPGGRVYPTLTAGSTVDVPDFDAQPLRANGYILVGLVGTTAQRPATLPAGVSIYVDTTLNKPIFHDGKTFRDHTGSAV